MKPISIAIDGPAGAGKSTVMEAVAARLGMKTLDTGAMYRAVGLSMLDMGVDLSCEEAIARACEGVEVTVKYASGEQRTLVNGLDYTNRLHDGEASRASSMVSRVAAVREKLVRAQREIAMGESLIMNGRDIGTKVLPDATVKIFLTASGEVRARRRCEELKAKGERADYESILRDMRDRDARDMTREQSPLVKAEDAIVVDSSDLTQDETIDKVIDIVSSRRSRK